MANSEYPIVDYPYYTELECTRNQKDAKRCWNIVIKAYPTYETYRKKFEYIIDSYQRHMSPTAEIARNRSKLIKNVIECDEIVCAIFDASTQRTSFYTKDLRYDVFSVYSRYGTKPLRDAASHNEEARKKFLYFEGTTPGLSLTKTIAIKKEYVNLFTLEFNTSSHSNTWNIFPNGISDHDNICLQVYPNIEEIKLFESARVDMYRYLNVLKKKTNKRIKEAELLLEQAKKAKQNVDEIFANLSEEDRKACEIYERLSEE